MNTSLITDVLGGTIHAEELSGSSNMIFSNSAMKLLNSSLLSLAGVHRFIYLSSILKLFYNRFLLNYAAFPWWVCTLGGNLAWGLSDSPFCNVLPDNANIWVFPVGLMVVVCFLVVCLLDL